MAKLIDQHELAVVGRPASLLCMWAKYSTECESSVWHLDLSVVDVEVVPELHLYFHHTDYKQRTTYSGGINQYEEV